ncbi:MAG: ABC transporter ATP-binding protein [Ruminococcaceae bacterium]|nr:ABC transporter ATP-binding protein [Oscillospiraceae bacterium]
MKLNLKENTKTFGTVLRYLKIFRLHFILSLLLTAVSVILTLYIPILVGNAIDLAVGKGAVDFSEIHFILLKIGISILLTGLIGWLVNVLNNRMTYGIVRNIRHRAFQRIQEFPISYIDSHQTGEIISRTITDVDQFADGLLLGFTQFFNGLMTIVGTLIFMLTISPTVALVVVIVTPLSLFVAAFIAKKTYSMFKLQSEIRSEQTTVIDEMITEHKIVVAFGREQQAQQEFDEVNDRLSGASLRAIFYSSITNPSTRFVNSLVYSLVALIGALLCLAGSSAMTVGKITSFLSYATQYTKPFNEISGVITELQNALACAARVFELIDQPIQEPDAEPAHTPEAIHGTVDFEEVSFSYTEDRPLIRSFNLSVQQGQHVAIVGPTGCGKTTLINLLMRFYDVKAGEIRLDGTDIRSYPRHTLRAAYGMVLQDTWLCSGTIRDNIAFGNPNATEEEVIAAAKAAHAHSFIRRLPNGYQTVISEDGGALSQGQKQLLCIARVMLCLPEMLILDEATSSIDTRTELRIQKAFSAMMQGRTSFIVAHRLSTIQDADIILVMKDGNIVEQGNHSDLLSQNGFYTRLYNSQFAKDPQ